jgi:hypothetical protein
MVVMQMIRLDRGAEIQSMYGGSWPKEREGKDVCLW